MSPSVGPTTAAVREYWNRHIHDLEITTHPVGSPGLFADLDQYHFEKLHHLLRLVDFDGYRGRWVLEVGCGAGHRPGPLRQGRSAGHRRRSVRRRRSRWRGRISRSRGCRPICAKPTASTCRLPTIRSTLVYAHGVVQYTAGSAALVDECRRVLKPGGEAVFQVYNRISWLNALSKLMKVPLEHEDAPVLLKYSAGEFRACLRGFRDVRIVEERFPVKSRLHGGWKGTVFNTFFVGTFNALPRALVRRFGWHLLAFCRK